VLKLVDPGILPAERPGRVAAVERILEDEVINGESFYLVHWKGLSSNLDSWVAESDFIDHGPIQQYRNRKLNASEGV
jgi:hypothetical protein